MGVDRRAHLDQADHLGDRHGLVALANCSVMLRAPSLAVPRLGAARPCSRRPAESGAAGWCAWPAGGRLPTRPDRAPPAAARLDPQSQIRQSTDDGTCPPLTRDQPAVDAGRLAVTGPSDLV
jgi:hypothetical protein